MGVETLLIAGAVAQAAGGISALQQGREQAEARIREGEEAAAQRKKDVQRQLARNTALFAKSGVSLEGSPLFALEQGVLTGQEDIRAIGETAQAQARGLVRGGRAAFLSGIGGAALTGSRAIPRQSATPQGA